MLPEALKHSAVRISDIKRPTDGTVGEGTLVRLFLALRKHMRSVSGSKRNFWICVPQTQVAGSQASGKMRE